MNRRSTLETLGAIAIVVLVGFIIYDCNKPVAKTASVATVAPIVQVAQTAPVIPTAAPATLAAPPDMNVGTLRVRDIVTEKEITTPKIVVTKKIKTPKIVVKEKIKTPEIVVEKKIVTPEIMVEKKITTPLLEADKVTTKLFEVDKMTVKEAEINFVKSSKKPAGKPAAALKCDGKDCWPKNPKGNYFPLGKFGDIPLIGNVNNPIFKEENSISAKRELRHKVWGKKMVVRNLTVPLESLLSPELRREITNHFDKMGSSWEVLPSDKNGDSCDEKTWIVNPATKTWSIRK